MLVLRERHRVAGYFGYRSKFEEPQIVVSAARAGAYGLAAVVPSHIGAAHAALWIVGAERLKPPSAACSAASTA